MGEAGLDFDVVAGSEVIRVVAGVVVVVLVSPGCVIEKGGEVRGTLVVDVKVREVTGIDVIEVGVLPAFVGVIEVVNGGVDVSAVARASAEEALVGPGVVFQVDVAREGVSVVLPGCVVAAVEDGVPVLVGVVCERVIVDATVDSVLVWSGAVLSAGEVGLSVGVVMVLLPAVDPAAVSRLLVGRRGVGLLWVTVSVVARVGVVPEVVVSLSVVFVLVVVGNDVKTCEGVPDTLEGVSVEVRSFVSVEYPVAPAYVGVGVCRVVVGVSVLTEVGILVVDVRTVPAVEGDGLSAEKGVMVVESLFEGVTASVRCVVTGEGVVVTSVVGVTILTVVWRAEEAAVIEVADVEGSA